MNKFVWSIFKTIMLAMIFVFVFDMGAYLLRALSLNQRMENTMVSMQKTIMENNYLPEGSYEMYKAIFIGIADDFNGTDSKGANHFINGYNLNYGNDAVDTLSDIRATRYNASGSATTGSILRKDMKIPASYGDVMVCQVSVQVNQPTWGFTNTHNIEGGKHSAVNWNNDRTDSSLKPKTTWFTYTYYIPCLKYQSVTED